MRAGYSTTLRPRSEPASGSSDGLLRTVRMLRAYVAWAACNDGVIRRDPKQIDCPDKRWRRTWASAYAGVVRWEGLFAALASINFHGVIQLTPFYDEKEPAKQREKLKREVACLRKLFDDTNRKAS